MIPNYVNTNLCDFTGDILESWGVKSTKYSKTYLPNSALSRGISKDTLEKTSKTCKDGKDDGKISFEEKVKNFGKGIIKPIKTMFSSPKNIALSAASIIGCGALIAATGGAAAPVLVATGLIGGGVQIGKGIYNQATAKTDAQAEKAWQDIGSGTFTVGASAAGAKASLKAAGVEGAKDMSMLTAIKTCIKDAPKNVSKSFSNASTKLSGLFGNIKSHIPKKSASTSATSQAPDPDVITINPEDIEIITDSSIKTKMPQQQRHLNIIDVDYVEIPNNNQTSLSAVSYKPKRMPQIQNPNQSTQLQTLSNIRQPNRLKLNPTNIQRTEPLALPEHIQENTSFLSKVKSLLKVFGLFKSQKS